MEVSAIGAAPLTQEQLKVAGFCSQLDPDDKDDNDEGGNKNAVDEDNDYVDEDHGRAEGILEVARTEVWSQAQQLVLAGRGWQTSPPCPPKAGWKGGECQQGC